tara:strand:+ start:1419 stop:2363 length:945 start_codon:yes stop_codon:yes gene_type:complete
MPTKKISSKKSLSGYTTGKKSLSRKSISNKSSKSSRKSTSNKKSLTKYKLCDTCFKVNKNNNNNNLISLCSESWKEFPYHIPILGRKEGSQEVHIDLGNKYKNRLIYFFGAKISTINLHSEYPKSYKNTNNYGLQFLDKNGKCTVKLNCPVLYKDTKMKGKGKETYMNHIHILVSNKDNTKWEDKLFTQNVLCCVNKKEVTQHINHNNRLIINALPFEYFKKGHIPTSYNLYYKTASNMTVKQLRKCVSSMIDTHPEYKKYIKKHNLKLTEVPLLVYCYDNKCSAGNKLALELYRAGFTNIVDYKDGIRGWMNR